LRRGRLQLAHSGGRCGAPAWQLSEVKQPRLWTMRAG
jgi:hypothetical protein